MVPSQNHQIEFLGSAIFQKITLNDLDLHKTRDGELLIGKLSLDLRQRAGIGVHQRVGRRYASEAVLIALSPEPGPTSKTRRRRTALGGMCSRV